MFIVDKEAGNRARQTLEAIATAMGLECDASLASYIGDGSSLRPFLTVDQARAAQVRQPTQAIQIVMYGTATINPAVQPALNPPAVLLPATDVTYADRAGSIPWGAYDVEVPRPLSRTAGDRT